jgi:hypothetical protein
MYRTILFFLICVNCIISTQGQDTKKIIQNYFFDLPIDSSTNYLINEIESNPLLRVNIKNKYIPVDNYEVLTEAQFKNNPNIVYLGFKNEFSLVKRTLDSLKLKEISLVLNYRAENKKAYKKQFKIFYKKFKPYFTEIKEKKESFSFVNQKVISFFNNKSNIPILKIILKETLVQIDNPESSIFSLIITYQAKI